MTARVALALSPHLDDAAFSCGGSLALLAATGWRVVIATLFTESVPDPSGFALACQLDKGLAPEIDYMALRRAEDAAAAAALGAEALWMPFCEAPHRGYGSAAELFAPARPEGDLLRSLADAVSGLVQDIGPALVLAPQAIGGHVDHVQLVRAIDAARLAVPTAWWCDFPYTAREARPAEPFRTRFQALSEHEIVIPAEAAEAKRQACLAYRSQLGFQFGGPAGLDARLAAAGSIERVRGAGLVPPAGEAPA